MTWQSVAVYLFIVGLVIAGCAGSEDPETLFNDGEYNSAFKLWFPRARSGDLVALNYIGIHYYAGLGVERDLVEAEKWFRRAAEKGFPDAQYNLGLMYENGQVVPQKFVVAYMWFHAAHKQGNKHALTHMTRMSREHRIMPNQVVRAEELAMQYIP